MSTLGQVIAVSPLLTTSLDSLNQPTFQFLKPNKVLRVLAPSKSKTSMTLGRTQIPKFVT